MLDSTCTNPSDPNSLKDLGPTIYVMPEEVNIDNINEEFTEELVSNYQQDEIVQDKKDVELDKELNDDEALDIIDKIETKTVRTNKTNTSTKSRAKEIDTKERVKTLLKRSGIEKDIFEDNKSVKSNKSHKSLKSNKSHKSLMDKIDQKINEFDSPEKKSEKLKKVSNPLIKTNEQKYGSLSKSKSDKSLVSNSEVGN